MDGDVTYRRRNIGWNTLSKMLERRIMPPSRTVNKTWSVASLPVHPSRSSTVRKRDLRLQIGETDEKGRMVSVRSTHTCTLRLEQTSEDDSPDEDQHGRHRDGRQHDLGALLGLGRELSWLGHLVVRRGRRG